MSGGWYRYNKFLVDCADLFGITTFKGLSMLPDEGEGLCRDMEGLSINNAKNWLFLSILQVHTSKIIVVAV